MTQKTNLKDIHADTVLTEFKTDNNKLSMWKIESDKDLLDAFIALGSNCKNIGNIGAVKILEKDILHLTLDDEQGETPTHGINQKHRNITDLNYATLGDVIMSVVNGIREDRYIHKTKGEMKKLLVDAYKHNILDMDGMEPTLKEAIIKAAEKTS